MARIGKGEADHLELGDWNATCFECGRKKKASYLKKHWQGYYVCPEHWEPRHPQDFVKASKDTQTTPWSQPMPADIYVNYCTPGGSSAYVDRATVDCAVVDYVWFGYDPITDTF